MPKTILVADDSITIQKVVGITFAGEDYNIASVDNGDDAIARARELKPDLLLADVVMPRKNGYEVCEAVKSDPSLQHIPVLLLAGTFEAFDEGRARAARADGHIAKPFETQALINKVKELLGEPIAQPKSATTARPFAGPPRAPPPTPTPAMQRPPTAVAPPRPPPSFAPALSAPSPGAARASGGTPASPVRPDDRVPSVSADAEADFGDLGLEAQAPSRPASAVPGIPAAVAPTLRSAVPDETPNGGISGTPSGNAPPNVVPGTSMPGTATPGTATATAPSARTFEGGTDGSDDAQPIELSELDDAEEIGRAPDHRPHGGPVASAQAPSDGGEAALREALTQASREVIERIVWEVVPQLAETILREQIDRLLKEREP
jgi:CheY-like chemotaxis protein